MNETSVEAAGLYKVYWDGGRKLEILRNVSLSINKGEGVAIWGPSGSGKTTLLNLLSGLDRPDGGSVKLGGTDIHSLKEAEKAEFRNRKIGFIFQFYHLLPEFTALENVMLPALIGGEPKAKAREKSEALLARVGLKERAGHFPNMLSGGEQQRVAIARALVNEPEFLFCDEPTGNLDIKMGLEIASLLRDVFREKGKTVVMVTHDERIAKMADRTWNLVSGEWER
jgi:ABC-type lipoprotein export system ATPase subunit